MKTENTHTIKNPQPTLGEAYSALRAELMKETPRRSAWDKGVYAFAVRILDAYESRTAWQREDLLPNNKAAFIECLRRSWGNWSAFDHNTAHPLTAEAVCKALCSPSEAKKKKNGILPPNAFESWADVATRAYSQAADKLVKIAARLGYFNGAFIAAHNGKAYSRCRYTREDKACNTIRFSEKVEAGNAGRRNLCEVELCLRKNHGKLAFSCSCAIWNASRTDWLMGGQCLEELLDLARRAKWSRESLSLLSEIVSLWKKYHLNDMHAGTPEQEAALKGFVGGYDERCEHLKQLGLYEVQHEGKPYRYGTAWIHQEIPACDIARIWNLLNI